MTADELRRLGALAEIRKHVVALRPQLEEVGMTDLWHLEESERLLTEMQAEPAAKNFRDLTLSFQWHLSFLMGEYEQFIIKKETP